MTHDHAPPCDPSPPLALADAPVVAERRDLDSSDTYPAVGTMPNTALFPQESQVGFEQPTPTGVEPFAAQTAVAWPTHSDIYPLVVSTPSNASSDFNIARYWGNLSPQYSVPSSTYGLDYASPDLPDQCDLTQAILYFRHGARYPTTGAAPSAFAEKLHNASLVGFNATGQLEFLNNWSYKLGAELLTPFGRKQNFDWGVAARQQYGALLNNFTEAGTLPVFRTQSQDRMVKTMLNFAAGFFGVPDYQTDFNLEIEIEASGLNASGAPYDMCPNSNNARGSVGSTAAAAFVEPWFNKTAERLNTYLSGNLSFAGPDITSMLQLCAYETGALGYSAFCPLFTQEEFEVFEQYYDIQFHGNNGFGSPVAAAQGLAYLQELVSRLNHTLITDFDSETNSTLDGNNVTFPLFQSIYADAAHEVSIMDALTALNLTALVQSGAPSNETLSTHTYVASKVVPFATSLQIQVMECTPSVPTKQIRFILNDAVIPLTYEGCNLDQNGLCAYDTVLGALINRIDEIDYTYDCYANYSVPFYGEVTNGRAPQ
ncbi:hypothetical protein JCM21900_004293 [Sporobolomyces salmonicolor]